MYYCCVWMQGVVGTNVTIKVLCGVMGDTSLGEPYARYAAVARLMMDTFSMKCLDANYSTYFRDMTNSSWEGPAAGGGGSDQIMSFCVCCVHSLFKTSAENGYFLHSICFQVACFFFFCSHEQRRADVDNVMSVLWKVFHCDGPITGAISCGGCKNTNFSTICSCTRPEYNNTATGQAVCSVTRMWFLSPCSKTHFWWQRLFLAGGGIKWDITTVI